MIRSLALMLCCCLTLAATESARSAASAAARDLAASLWRWQGADGRFASRSYAVLGSGQALTPVLLRQLLACASVPHDHAARSLDWIRSRIDEHGALGISDPDLIEYPVYASAAALACLRSVAGSSLAQANDEHRIATLVAWLGRAQYDDGEGYGHDHPAHGLWGFAPAVADQPGFCDIAHSRWVAEALGPDLDAARRNALLVALATCQKDPARPHPRMDGRGLVNGAVEPDGGFYFSPIAVSANKAGAVAGPASAPASYATTTADGILALLACGIPLDDPRLATAWAWLQRHPQWDGPPGIASGGDAGWRQALRLYHAAVRARVHASLDINGDWRGTLLAELAHHRRADGLYANPAGFLMKEDDPLLGSALALEALLAAAR